MCVCQSCRWPAVTTLRPSDTAGSARSGFAVSATQLAMPDAGLISYAEMLTIGKNICDAPWPEKPGFLCILSIGFYVLFYDSKFNRGTPSPVGHVWNLTSSLESHATLLCTIYWLKCPNFNFVLIELAHSRGFYFIPQKRAGTQPKQQFNIFSTRKPAEYIYPLLWSSMLLGSSPWEWPWCTSSAGHPWKALGHWRWWYRFRGPREHPENLAGLCSCRICWHFHWGSSVSKAM